MNKKTSLKKFINIKIDFSLIFVFVILTMAFVLRVYRLGDLLGFYYDQGRDGLVIWDLWHKGKMFLIGPTTGIEGIFRGPYYYYLIAPFYLLGKGNPVFPSVFLSFTSVLGILLLYTLGKKVFGKEAGIFAVILASFSYKMIMASRWLSNPTPMLLLSVLFLWFLLKGLEKKSWAWPGMFFLFGLSLFHFGSAGEVYYIIAILFVLVKTILKDGFGKKSSINFRVLLYSAIAFFITILPLVIFDLKHGFILSGNIIDFLSVKKSFSIPDARFIQDKLEFFVEVFGGKLFVGIYEQEKLILLFLSALFFFFLSRMLKNKYFGILLFLFICPVVGLMFFKGNFGNVYDYYLTGYYLIFILLVGCILASLWKTKIGKVLVFLFLFFFLNNNVKWTRSFLVDKVEDELSVAFKNQKEAIRWVYQDASDNKFNVDVYVPPVISYSYNYLFTWYGGSNFGYLPVEESRELLYTLYEPDLPHPERLEAWLERQKGIGKVESEVRFGGITVQRRERL